MGSANGWRAKQEGERHGWQHQPTSPKQQAPRRAKAHQSSVETGTSSSSASRRLGREEEGQQSTDDDTCSAGATT